MLIEGFYRTQTNTRSTMATDETHAGRSPTTTATHCLYIQLTTATTTDVHGRSPDRLYAPCDVTTMLQHVRAKPTANWLRTMLKQTRGLKLRPGTHVPGEVKTRIGVVGIIRTTTLIRSRNVISIIRKHAQSAKRVTNSVANYWGEMRVKLQVIYTHPPCRRRLAATT